MVKYRGLRQTGVTFRGEILPVRLKLENGLPALKLFNYRNCALWFLIFEDWNLVSGLRVVIDVIETKKQEDVQTKDAFINESEIETDLFIYVHIMPLMSYYSSH